MTSRKAPSIDQARYGYLYGKNLVPTSAGRIVPRTSLRHRLAGLNQPGGMFNLSGNAFNPHAKTWALLFLIVASIFTGGILAQSVLFHSAEYVNGACVRELWTSPCNDPTTFLWKRVVLAPGDLTDWNLSPGQRQAYSSNCDNSGTGIDCISLDAFSGNNSVAITKNPINDLSVALSKTLGILGQFKIDSSGFGIEAYPTVNTWGIFITTNSTAPTNNGAGGQYSPLTDPSVVFAERIGCLSGTCGGTGGSGTYDLAVYVLRHTGVKDTLSLEDTGGCVGETSCFLRDSINNDITGCFTNPCTGGNVMNDDAIYLNYTGATTATTTCTASTPTANLVGAGCSWVCSSYANQPSVNFAAKDCGQSSTLPANPFSAGHYYLGVWSSLPGFSMEWSFFPGFPPAAGGSIGMGVTDYVPSVACNVASSPNGNVCPQIDTSGYFGPIIKALIGLGVFIIQNLFNFASYLWNILQPVFTTIVNLLIVGFAGFASLIVGVIKAVLNAIGIGIGIPSLGDNLFTLFSDVSSFFTTFFGNALAQVSSFITFLNNGYTTVSSSFSTYWTDLVNWTSGLKDLLGGLWVIGTQMFTVGFVFMFSGWFLYGAKKFSDSTGEGMEWFSLTRLWILLGFNIALWLLTFLLVHVITPSLHAVMATGEAKKTAEPDIVIGGTGVG